MLSLLHDAALEILGFLGAFSTIGAIGFRYGVLLNADRLGEPVPAPVTRQAARLAAVIGLGGAILATVMFIHGQAEHAADHGTTLASALTTMATTVPLALVVVAALAFALASTGTQAAWPLAAITTLAFALRSVATGKWASMVNPLHILGGSLWIGTLAILIVAGVSAALGTTLPADQRAPIVSRWVNAFSPLALSSATLLGVTGVITAVRHLKYVSALWTTSYGFALDAKLCAVTAVVALGAWNWRRIRPICHTEPGARQLQRSARAELAAAAVVLAITGILVSVPSPKLPH
jgi:putative copper export protein